MRGVCNGKEEAAPAMKERKIPYERGETCVSEVKKSHSVHKFQSWKSSEQKTSAT